MNYLDVLSRLGAGSAHPGGFSATMSQLSRYPLPAGSRVLEVGCGTGRTSCYLAKQGFDITGLDLRPDMLVKAKFRAEAEQLDIRFMEGDITALPFEDATFDVVLAESVTNFADIGRALAEYARVLRPGGILYDREVIAPPSITQKTYEEITSFFQLKSLLTEQKWIELLQASGFIETTVCDRSPFTEQGIEDQIAYPDMHQVMDPEALLDASVWQMSLAYNEMITANRDYLEHALFIARK
ncbi:class I SAM-dependent methyltransferase [Paenibacillus elgii]|uniref:Class I SAM-dependent methyltransferase n=1 Tax=Paenibacillus elgii TaxID=189691 RepID=A0A2T6G5B5_9BACL|nr:class I SAM-dependent methyltransferase [Paenibacillus elgii]PUA39335.1 class I SAM-dependent methyltransferase [Paenibacillus elgii]